MNLRSTTALLVDDDLTSYQATQQRLENDGYSVIVARDATEGLSRARQSMPNVIFAHLVAGRRDNVAFIQALRSDDACRHMPVIVLAGTTKPDTGPRPLRPVSRDRW